MKYLKYVFVLLLSLAVLPFAVNAEAKPDAEIKDTNEVKLEDNIVNLAAISSGTDANDFFSMKIPVPKKRSKSVQYNIKITDDNKDHNGILSAILEGSEKEENDEKDDNSEKNISNDINSINTDDNDA